ncbi:uncharacterized protein METZ01_LOCUS325444 [marine metagenome]|uniref:Uncharacterized protein n=1 Tax=marine metagenome TaxID=408172 RepID=A0A382PII2_9ZZZZ
MVNLVATIVDEDGVVHELPHRVRITDP